MKRYAIVACIALLASSRSATACFDTIITYEITRECSVRILHLQDEHRDPVPASDWDAAVEHWTGYLQRNATTDFDKKQGVSPTTRKIHRDDDPLYCEFDENGAITVAYVLPAFWDDEKREWIVTGREPIPVSNGKLVDYMSYESTITTCY